MNSIEQFLLQDLLGRIPGDFHREEASVGDRQVIIDRPS
jgi:hypothetical protein